MAIQYQFGSGTLFGTRTDLTVQTPYQFGAIQDVTLDVSFDLKELYGQAQFPLAVGRGKAKVTGKAKIARFNARAFNDLFWGQTIAAGQTLTGLNEGPTVIPTTPFQITVTHSANFVDDLGVVNVSTGAPMQLVANSPSAGQYSVTAGVYTFANADNVSAISVYISYTYTSSSTGFKFTVANQLMGSAPTFSSVFYETYNGNVYQVKLLQCISNKLSLNFKNDDFTMADFDFSAFADSSANIMQVSLTQ